LTFTAVEKLETETPPPSTFRPAGQNTIPVVCLLPAA
jgi:hypothetical protein